MSRSTRTMASDGGPGRGAIPPGARTRRHLQAQLDGRQRLSELVVQLVRQETPLFFAGGLEAAVQVAEAAIGALQRAQGGNGGAPVCFQLLDDEIHQQREPDADERNQGCEARPVLKSVGVDLSLRVVQKPARDQGADDQVSDE